LSAKTVDSIPDLFVVLVIFLITNWLVRLSRAFFKGVSSGDIVISWFDSDAALPTSKIFTGIIWIFGIVMAYPYIPGSNTNAFKGIGMFLGLLISLGASGMVGQVIGGMVLMYSRAMKVGDFVRINDNIGKVMEIGFFSTKLKTMKNEEINIPNSVLMGSITKNFSRLSKSEGLIIHSSVTIGYDVPWRQIHALLMNAAEKTAGLKKTPAPFVLQKSLGDFYVDYEINAFIDKPETYVGVKTELHANIQDEFNKYGVQIMSPHFEMQPPEKVWVPKERWNEEPAKKE
jgi:small-conductance mechanosensitive channel